MISKILLLSITISYTIFGWFLPYENPNKLPYPQFVDLDSKIAGAWETYKEEYIESNGLIFKDKDANYNNSSHFVSSDTHKYAVSEGIGYVMLVSLYMNDQETFDKVWSAGKNYFGFPSLNDAVWLVRYDKNNVNEVSTSGYGSATDADLDVATALIFASELADKGYWKDNGNYKSSANTLIDAIYEKDQYGDWMKLGTSWGGKNDQNLSYFAPAYFRLFDDWQGTNRWNTVIDNHYGTLQKNPGYPKGIIRNWCDANGNSITLSGTGSDENTDMGFEAIRVPWRIGVDAMWYGATDAKAYCKNAMDFAKDPVELGTGMFGAESPFEMQYDKSWLKSTPKAMWGSCASSIEQDLHDEYAKALAKTYSSVRKRFNEDDQYYFATLTLLGALVVNGSFPNVYEDLKKYSAPKDMFIEDFSTNINVGSGAVDFSADEERFFYAKMSKVAEWEIELKSDVTGIVLSDEGKGSTPFYEWRFFKVGDNIFKVGETVTVTLKVNGKEEAKISFEIGQLPERYKETLIDDFDDKDDVAKINATWSIWDDKSIGGGSSADYEFVASDFGSAIKVNYEVSKGSLNNGTAGIQVEMKDKKVLNLSDVTFFSFYHKGDAMRFQIVNPNDDLKNGALGYDVEKHTEWTRVIVTNNVLTKENSELTAFEVSDSISSMQFVAKSKNNLSGNFSVDEFILNGSFKTLDGEDVGVADAEVTDVPSVDVYPNPFNPVVNIKLNNLSGQNLSVDVFDIKGRKITQLLKGQLGNNNTISWNANKYASGIYFLRVQSSSVIYNKKLLLVK